jgi:hypothetical protein
MSVFSDLIHFGFFVLAMSRKKLHMAPMVSKKPHHGSTQHVVSHELSQHEWEMKSSKYSQTHTTAAMCLSSFPIYVQLCIHNGRTYMSLDFNFYSISRCISFLCASNHPCSSSFMSDLAPPRANNLPHCELFRNKVSFFSIPFHSKCVAI